MRPGHRYVLTTPRDAWAEEEHEMVKRLKRDWLRPGETLVALRDGYRIGWRPEIPALVRRARARAR